MVIGASGSGEALAAGVIYGLHEGWLIEDAVRRGHATAAVSLRSLGTTDAVLPVAESLAMATKWGWRKPD